MKQFQVITLDVLLPADEINEIHADINDDLQIKVNIYNGLIHQGQLWITLFWGGKDRNKWHFWCYDTRNPLFD